MTIAGSIVIVALIVARITLNYHVLPVVPVLFALPLLVTLLWLAVDVQRPSKQGSVPAMIVILGLSVVAVTFVPMAEVLLANVIGVI